MNVNQLIKVFTSAVCVSVWADKMPDEGGEYLKSYGIFEELSKDYGKCEVKEIYPSCKDVLCIAIDPTPHTGARKVYTVEYKMHSADTVKHVDVIASNKIEAYNKALYGEIRKWEDGAFPYSAWVHSVTYSNGNYRRFNTFEGNPY